MFVKELELGLDYEAAGLQTPTKKVSFTGYILKNDDPYCKSRTRVKRPAVLVLPGGGYGFTSPREATPIAMAFAAKGFTTFVLHYSTHADGVLFPTEVCEAAAAMKVIRAHAEALRTVEIEKQELTDVDTPKALHDLKNTAE